MTDRPTNPDDTDATARFDRPQQPTPSPVEPPATADQPPAAAAPAPPPAATDPSIPHTATEPAGAATEPAPPPSRQWPPPTWRRDGEDSGRLGTIVFGAILLVVGLWFFADQTLGLEMPRLRWSQLWPLLLIGIGAWIAIGSLRRR